MTSKYKYMMPYGHKSIVLYWNKYIVLHSYKSILLCKRKYIMRAHKPCNCNKLKAITHSGGTSKEMDVRNHEVFHAP